MICENVYMGTTSDLSDIERAGHMTDVAVVGAAGYTGIEAVRWVLAHPRLRLALATSEAEAGRRLSDVYPALSGMTDAVFVAPEPRRIADSADVALLAVPHTAALAYVPQLLAHGVRVIDLSADFRLRDARVYEEWYGVAHTAPDLLAEAVYGLPELDRTRLPGARLVACPGCYPTAAILAALPVLERGLWTGEPIVVDAKSGVSGAGRTPTSASHFVSVAESLAAYKVAAHRHTPEIEQALSHIANEPVGVVFAPHLVPMSRGLLATVYLSVEEGLTTRDAIELYRLRYAGEPFIHVHQQGVWPSTHEVRGSNRAAIGVHMDNRTRTLVATCAIDNLGKGAAGQAVQCLNAMLGFPETEGLGAVGEVV